MRTFLAFLSVFVILSCGKKIASTPSKVDIYQMEIESKLNLYMDKMMDGDYEEMMDITYPKLFEIAPREAIVAVFKETFAGEEMKITFANHKILKISDNLVMVENRLYTLVDYNLDMVMALKGEMEEAAAFMLPEFENEYGKENVTYDKDKSIFSIKMKNQMIAIKENNEWYFLENKKEQKALLKMILDSDVLRKLGIDVE